MHETLWAKGKELEHIVQTEGAEMVASFGVRVAIGNERESGVGTAAHDTGGRHVSENE